MEISSIFNEKISNDDAALMFKDKKYCIYHGNDNWFELEDKNIKKIKKFSYKRKFLFASQTNSKHRVPFNIPSIQERKNFRIKK